MIRDPKLVLIHPGGRIDRREMIAEHVFEGQFQASAPALPANIAADLIAEIERPDVARISQRRMTAGNISTMLNRLRQNRDEFRRRNCGAPSSLLAIARMESEPFPCPHATTP